MRILILGITGMLGHVLWHDLQKNHDVYGTIRGNNLDEGRIIKCVDAFTGNGIDLAFKEAKPEIVINCIGVIKQLKEAHDPILSITVNSLFPHILARKCQETGCRLIHISTDCVFSGKKGNYSENDIPDPVDIYGRSKLLGEVDHDNVLTLRTSLIGRELRGKYSLLEWFLAQKGTVKGYKRAIFSGFTTYAFTDILKELIDKYPQLNGVYHVASESINKYKLLVRLKDVFQKNIDIIPDENLIIDRSLDSSKFQCDTSIKIPSWNEMLEDLKKKEVA